MSRRVVVLAVLVLLVAGWLGLRELPILESERERALRELYVFENVPDVVDTVRIRQYEREILVARDGERWFLRSPIDEEVPYYEVEALIERLVTTERWRRVGRAQEGADWGLYGLADDSPGRVRIELIGEDGRSVVDVGLLSPGSHNVWVRRGGSDDLEVCFEDLYNIANASHHGLRDPRLFAVVHDDLTRLRFATEDREWTAVRGDEGLWFLGRADGPRLKRWLLEDYAFAVAGLRVDGYLRDHLEPADWAAYGLDRPWGTVEWEATEGRSGALWLGNEVDAGLHFGRRAGLESVFQIAASVAPYLEADPGELLDHNPVYGNFLNAEKIRVVGEEGYVDVIRETPGARVETDLGPVEGGDWVQVAGRNVQLGVEELQPLAEMIVPASRDAVDQLEAVEASLTVHWPDRVAELWIGTMAGGVWIAYDGGLYQVEPDLLLRVREVLKLRDAQSAANLPPSGR